MNTARRTSVFLVALSIVAVCRPASAHPTTVDGSLAEWSTRGANFDNLGIIAVGPAFGGEYVWRDPAADTRTDLASPETISDITQFRVTATATGLSFAMARPPGVVSGTGLQLQIAIDVDRVSGSGQSFFAGFADTSVVDAARWEFLVQTTFGVGTGARVLDTAFNSVAAVPASESATAVEVAVPWSALGLSGPPTNPLRFTVATFRQQPASTDTVDIGGAATSNALDCVTDYGNPQTSAFPNTFAEVQDGDVDYFFDVFFAASGEPYAPLVVQSFISAPTVNPGGEFETIRNVSPIAIPLAGYKAGDEEDPDGGEAMRLLPSVTLAPGAVFVIANSATTYFTNFGRQPDGETTSTDAAVPDLASYAPWATGAFTLGNTGDVIMILDPSNTILDVVAFGGDTYPGIVGITPTLGATDVASRDLFSSDTDDCVVDFHIEADACIDATSCTNCQNCLANACDDLATGTSCADSDQCNGAETCLAGTCTAGPPPTCEDNEPCTLNDCVPAQGCVNTPLALGTPCDDATVCNGDETCDGAGQCDPGTPLDCDDSDDCTGDTCDAVTGCENAQEPAGTSCDTGLCTGSCDVNGDCQCGNGGGGGGGGGAGGGGTGGAGGGTGGAGGQGGAGGAGQGGAAQGGAGGGGGAATGGAGGVAEGGAGGAQEGGGGNPSTGGSGGSGPTAGGGGAGASGGTGGGETTGGAGPDGDGEAEGGGCNCTVIDSRQGDLQFGAGLLLVALYSLRRRRGRGA